MSEGNNRVVSEPDLTATFGGRQQSDNAAAGGAKDHAKPKEPNDQTSGDTSATK